MKILEFQATIIKNNLKQKKLCDNYENNKNITIPFENHKIHWNHMSLNEN